MSENKQLSFVVDQETLDLINQLKKDLKAPTAAAVFRKALAIAQLANDASKNSNGVVAIRGQSEPAEKEINLLLRS